MKQISWKSPKSTKFVALVKGALWYIIGYVLVSLVRWESSQFVQGVSTQVPTTWLVGIYICRIYKLTLHSTICGLHLFSFSVCSAAVSRPGCPIALIYMDNTCDNVIDVVDGHSGQMHICQSFAAMDTKHDHTCGRCGDVTVAWDLQGKRKWYLGIQMLITARSLEATIINFIYSFFPLRCGSF